MTVQHTTTKQHGKPSAIGQSQLKALYLVARYATVTAEQACQAPTGWAKTSQTFARATFSGLVRSGLCLKRRVGRRTPGGSEPTLYFLSQKGGRYLASCGVDYSVAYEPKEVAALSPLHLEHRRQLVGVLIAADRLVAGHDDVRLARLLNEYDCLRLAEKVQLPNGIERRVAPDGFLDFRWRTPEGKSHQFPVVVELDRASAKARKWADKIDGLVGWITSETYRTQYAAGAIVAVVATTGDRHAQTLCGWTKTRLGQLGRDDLAANFRFTGQSTDAMDAATFFRGEHWLTCANDTRTALLPGGAP